MVKMYQTDFLQSYSPFVGTRYSHKGENEASKQSILGGCLFINAFLNFSPVSCKQSIFNRFKYAEL